MGTLCIHVIYYTPWVLFISNIKILKYCRSLSSLAVTFGMKFLIKDHANQTVTGLKIQWQGPPFLEVNIMKTISHDKKSAHAIERSLEEQTIKVCICMNLRPFTPRVKPWVSKCAWYVVPVLSNTMWISETLVCGHSNESYWEVLSCGQCLLCCTRWF